MTNPFDRNFYRFFIGFICILCVSFAVLYFVGRYGMGAASPSASVEK
ncbi:hypothetical protein KGP36_04780 [Patescibacteria group bacterium]|nr:hypothetical protein [Patescibacteria group bacterium]MDE1941347.1 hypothetical protein [Patescibacteria group bacterium]